MITRFNMRPSVHQVLDKWSCCAYAAWSGQAEKPKSFSSLLHSSNRWFSDHFDAWVFCRWAKCSDDGSYEWSWSNGSWTFELMTLLHPWSAAPLPKATIGVAFRIRLHLSWANERSKALSLWMMNASPQSLRRHIPQTLSISSGTGITNSILSPSHSTSPSILHQFWYWPYHFNCPYYNFPPKSSFSISFGIKF